jgi:hypothetical protein
MERSTVAMDYRSSLFGMYCRPLGPGLKRVQAKFPNCADLYHFDDLFPQNLNRIPELIEEEGASAPNP